MLALFSEQLTSHEESLTLHQLQLAANFNKEARLAGWLKHGLKFCQKDMDKENMSKDTNKPNVVEPEPGKLVSNDFTYFTTWVEIQVLKYGPAMWVFP